MSGARGIFTIVVLVWLGVGLQASLAPRVSILGAQPDFVLVVVTCVGLFSTRIAGTVTGFFGGLLYGAVAGANLGHYVVSRTLTGFAASWAASLGVVPGPLSGALFASAGTIFGQLVLMFLAPQPSLIGFLGDTLASAVYNGVLAVPLCALLTRMFPPEKY